MLQGPLWSALAQAQTSLAEQNQRLFLELQRVHGLSDAQMSRIRSIFVGSRVIGQGNPAITRHPMTPEQCHARVRKAVPPIPTHFSSYLRCEIHGATL
jgi:hypothetical protein